MKGDIFFEFVKLNCEIKELRLHRLLMVLSTRLFLRHDLEAINNKVWFIDNCISEKIVFTKCEISKQSISPLPLKHFCLAIVF